MLRMLILLLLLIPDFVYSQKIMQTIKRDYQQNKITFEEYLVNKALAVYKPELLQAEYFYESGRLPVKCGTFVSYEIKKNWHSLSQANKNLLKTFIFRPTDLPDSYISPSGKFKIHYTTQDGDSRAVLPDDQDNNNVPDYVDSVAAIFDYSYSFLVDSLGYNPPPSDFGEDGDEYDIYIVAESNGLYGETFFEDNIDNRNKYNSYITIDNDYSGSKYTSKGLDGLRVTAAHEFFHAIQAGYKITFNSDFDEQEVFFYEISSTWMEDMIFDEINDYSGYTVTERPNAENDTIGYMYTFFRQKNRPTFTTYDFSYEYGNCLWNHMLAKKYGPQIIREIWEEIENRLVLDAIDLVLHKYRYGSTFNKELVDYSIWNYFTGSRADPVKYYPEGADYPELTYMDEIQFIADLTYSNESNHLTFNHILFFDKLTKNNIALIPINFEYNDDENNNSSTFKLEVSRRGTNQFTSVTDGFKVRDVVDDYNSWAFSAIVFDSLKNTSIVPFHENNEDEDEDKRPTNIVAIHPNPFITSKHPMFFVDYYLKKQGSVKISIFSENGKKIDDFYDSNVLDGPNSFVWYVENLKNASVGSGIYILLFEANDVKEIAKFAVIN